MDIDATFLPVAVELIDRVFPTEIVYHRLAGQVYDPATGEVVNDWADKTIKAGILSRARTEGGGIGETYSMQFWIQHSPSGIYDMPTTADAITYDSTRWKVTDVAPTYSSKGLIASKVTVRAA